MTKAVENNDKDKILSQVLSDIEKQFGKGAIMKLGSESHLEVDSVPSGSLSLDIALGIGGSLGRIILPPPSRTRPGRPWPLASP